MVELVGLVGAACVDNERFIHRVVFRFRACVFRDQGSGKLIPLGVTTAVRYQLTGCHLREHARSILGRLVVSRFAKGGVGLAD